jgi:pimeloyl-ACP methyl ester carboxylesterase
MIRIWLAAFAAAALLAGPTLAPGSANAAERWLTLPPPPAELPSPALEGRVAHDGARIWFATYGEGSPVILLHGDGGASEDFGFQLPALLADHHRVILIDSRGQGRSSMGDKPIGYTLMASDVLAVMDALHIDKAAVVGWSDGAILGLVMAMRHPERETRVYAFGANMDLDGLRSDWTSNPLIPPLIAASRQRYERISPTPTAFEATEGALGHMMATEPTYSAGDLAAIRGPAIAIVDGDHEEFITRAHTEYLARTIPSAKLIILPRVSHFAPLQAPDEFNASMIAFLDAR